MPYQEHLMSIFTANTLLWEWKPEFFTLAFIHKGFFLLYINLDFAILKKRLGCFINGRGHNEKIEFFSKS